MQVKSILRHGNAKVIINEYKLGWVIKDKNPTTFTFTHPLPLMFIHIFFVSLESLWRGRRYIKKFSWVQKH